jgi:hypothetical protein
MMQKSEPQREGVIILYTTPEGMAGVEVFFQDETFCPASAVWPTCSGWKSTPPTIISRRSINPAS